MSIGFTGTRQGIPLEQCVGIYHWLQNVRSAFGPPELNEGEAPGGDRAARHFAELLGYAIRPWPAVDREFLARNKLIVHHSQFMIAAPAGFEEERRSGTWMTVRYARSQKRPGVIVWPCGHSSPLISVRHACVPENVHALQPRAGGGSPLPVPPPVRHA